MFLAKSCFNTGKKCLIYLGVSSSRKLKLEMRSSLPSPKSRSTSDCRCWLHPLLHTLLSQNNGCLCLLALYRTAVDQTPWGTVGDSDLFQEVEGSDSSLYLPFPHLLARNILGVFLRALSRFRRFHIIKHLDHVCSISWSHRRTLWKTINIMPQNLQAVKRQILRNIYHFPKLTNITKLTCQGDQKIIEQGPYKYFHKGNSGVRQSKRWTLAYVKTHASSEFCQIWENTRAENDPSFVTWTSIAKSDKDRAKWEKDAPFGLWT